MDIEQFLRNHFGDNGYTREDKGMILKAIHVVILNQQEHQRVRKNGEPFMTHSLSAASTLYKYKLPAYIVCAELMHDLVEDSDFLYPFERVEQNFGDRIRLIVEGVTKLPKDQFASKADRIADSYARMKAMLPDYWEIIFVKLADRKHNLETLDAFEAKKQIAICEDTLKYLVPIAQELAPQFVPPEYQLALQDLTAAVASAARKQLTIAA